MAKVMAVILNYNSFEDSVKCAKLLKKQKDVDFKICIVDNCSTDGKIKHLEKFGKENDIVVIANHENRGFSAGNNIGLKKATEYEYEYALVINPDVEIRDCNYISKAITEMEKDSNIAVLGTDVVNVQGLHQNPIKEMNFFEETCFPIEMIKGKFRKELPNVIKNAKSGECEKLSGCCFFLRMDFAQKVSYLDENVFMYCEESILGKMVKKENCKMHYMSELVAYHQHFSTQKGNPLPRLKNFMESRLYYLDNYSGYTGMKLKIAKKSREMQYKMYENKIKKKNKSMYKRLQN